MTGEMAEVRFMRKSLLGSSEPNFKTEWNLRPNFSSMFFFHISIGFILPYFIGYMLKIQNFIVSLKVFLLFKEILTVGPC